MKIMNLSVVKMWTRLAGAAAVLSILMIGGCSLDDASAPPLAGPSDFGVGVSIVASPDQLPRDGSSQSVVTVTVRDASGKPISGKLLNVSTSLGTLSQNQVVTDSNGQATFALTAPSSSAVGASALISVVPVGSNGDTPVARQFSIVLTGLANSTAPTPDFTFAPAAPERGTSVRFDASATRDENAPCLDACSYSWNFGDNTSGSGRMLNHTFSSSGTFNVVLTVTDAAGTSASISKPVSVSSIPPPTVTMTVSPTPPIAGQEAFFTAIATAAPGHSISRYAWNFGDGTTETTMTSTVAKTYIRTGTYVARVIVTDDVGQTAAASVTFTIAGNGVTASFTFSPTDPKDGESVQFDGSTSTAPGGATIVKWTWNFGDGSSIVEGAEPTIAHTFPNDRTYVVRLTVTDSTGRTGTTTQEVTVDEP
jgi:PKD repeat protein